MLKRVLFFVYGVACYAIFLATFLYAIGFVGGFPFMPTSIDGPLEGPLGQAIAVNCLLLGIFAVQHSVMARRGFKERWTAIVPWSIERSTYVLAASLALILLFAEWRPMGGEVWTVDNEVGRLALWALCALGWGLVLLSTFLINHFDLFGLRQVWLPLVGRHYTPVALRTPRLYRHLRHQLRPPALEGRPGHDAVLNGEDAEQQDVDDDRRGDGARRAGIDRLGHEDVADEADGVEERQEEDDVGYEAIEHGDDAHFWDLPACVERRTPCDPDGLDDHPNHLIV
jgi:protein-S-isoprenylcysteine O-methyltransferase Ste14